MATAVFAAYCINQSTYQAMERETLLPVMLVVSFGATLACWAHIWRSVDHLFFKVTGALIAALPFFGPIFYFFTRLPPRLPEDAQAPLGLWGTSVREQTTAEMFKAWRKHLDRLYGADHPGRKKKDPARRRPE